VTGSSVTFLRLLLVLFGALALALVAPFLQPVLLAGLFAYLVAPLQKRLVRRLGPTVGTAATMLVTVLIAVIPLLVLVSVAAGQALDVLRTAELPDPDTVAPFLETIIGPITQSGLVGPLTDAFQTGLRGLVGGLLGVLGGIPAFLVGAVIFLFTFFYLLRDGDDLVAWLRTAAPLEPGVMDELLSRTDDLLWAAVVGNVIVAALQAVLTVFGFLAIGFDNIVFWGVATFALSLLPIIGASIVWIPAVAYLLLVGNVPAAVGLLVYGSVVVSGSDNFVRPLAMQRGAELNSGLLVLGIFGGVAVFGFLGLFIGPVVLGLAKSIVELLEDVRTDPDMGD